MAGFAPMGIPLGNIGPTTGADFSPYFEMMRQQQMAAQAEADRAAQAKRLAEAQRFEREGAEADRAYRSGLEARQLGWQKAQFGGEMAERERQRGFEREQLQTELAARGAAPGRAQPYGVEQWVEEGMPGLGELTTIGNPAEMSARLKEMEQARRSEVETFDDFKKFVGRKLPSLVLDDVADEAALVRLLAQETGMEPRIAQSDVERLRKQWRQQPDHKRAVMGPKTPEQEALEKELETANAYMHNVLKSLSLSDDDRKLVWPYLRDIAATGDPALIVSQLRDELEELSARQPSPALMTGASDEDRAKSIEAYQKAVDDQKKAVAEKRRTVRMVERALSSMFAAHKRTRKKD